MDSVYNCEGNLWYTSKAGKWWYIGRPGIWYGIQKDLGDGRFGPVPDICEETPMLAWARLYQRLAGEVERNEYRLCEVPAPWKKEEGRVLTRSEILDDRLEGPPVWLDFPGRQPCWAIAREYSEWSERGRLPGYGFHELYEDESRIVCRMDDSGWKAYTRPMPYIPKPRPKGRGVNG